MTTKAQLYCLALTADEILRLYREHLAKEKLRARRKSKRKSKSTANA